MADSKLHSQKGRREIKGKSTSALLRLRAELLQQDSRLTYSPRRQAFIGYHGNSHPLNIHQDIQVKLKRTQYQRVCSFSNPELTSSATHAYPVSMAWQQSLTFDLSSSGKWLISSSSERSKAGSGLLQNWKELYWQSSVWVWSSAWVLTKTAELRYSPTRGRGPVRNHGGPPPVLTPPFWKDLQSHIPESGAQSIPCLKYANLTVFTA